jgi:hypothetical protein
MGTVASVLAGGFSMASMGLQAEGAQLQAQGTSAADIFKAEQLERAAQYGDLKAEQTSAAMTRNLNVTLGNIDAIRAAAHTDITSPTGAAYRGRVEEVGGEQRGITVENILAQSQEDVANAAYLRQASGRALLSGDIAATADILKGTAGFIGSFAGAGGGNTTAASVAGNANVFAGGELY